MAKNNQLNLGAKLEIGGDTAFSGAFTFTGTLTGNTAVTFPTSGTLVTSATAITNPILLNAHPVLGFTDVGASAVNYVSLNNAATGLQAIVTAAGSDTNIRIDLRPKGTGLVLVGNNTLSGYMQVNSGGDAYLYGVTSNVEATGSASVSAGTTLALTGTSNITMTSGAATYILPTSNAAGVLTNDGAGNLSWV